MNDAQVTMAPKVLPRPKVRQRTKHFLKEWREFRNLTQDALADRAGLTQGMISHLETGRSDFTGELLDVLSEALGTDRVNLLIRNPLDKSAPWTIWETVQGLPPEDQERVARIVDTFRKTGTE